jgi:hypothetical protein
LLALGSWQAGDGVPVGALPRSAAGGGLPRGTIIVPLAPGYDPGVERPVDPAIVHAAADEAGVAPTPIDESSHLIAAPLTAVRVGLYGGGGAPFNQAAILAACGFPVRFLSDAEVRAGELATVDVFVMPGGGARAMHGQLEPLGEEGCRAIAAFVRRGGMYVGCCAGAYDCIVNSDAFVGSCPAQRSLQLVNAAPWRAAAAVEFLDLQSPGVGVVTARNERPEHPVMFGMAPTIDVVHYNGPVLDPIPERVVEGGSAAIGLAAFAGWTERFTPAEAFAGPPASEQPTYLARAVAAGRYAAVAGELGVGRVVAFGSHPELGFDLPMAEWGAAARMLANAVLWQASERPHPPAPSPEPRARGSARPAGRISLPVGSGLGEAAALAATVATRARALQDRSIEPAPGWLAPEYALAVFGLSPTEVWRRALDDIPALAAEIERLAARLRERVGAVVARGELSAPARAAILQLEAWLLAERPPGWQQDAGFQGVQALLRAAIRMCDEAADRWDATLGPPAGPYAYLDESPYHLVAGSYLAAIGCVAGALQVLRAAEAELATATWLGNPRRQAVALGSPGADRGGEPW